MSSNPAASRVRLWDVTGKRPRELLVAEPKFRPKEADEGNAYRYGVGRASAVALSPDGKVLVCAAGPVARVWKVDGKKAEEWAVIKSQDSAGKARSIRSFWPFRRMGELSRPLTIRTAATNLRRFDFGTWRCRRLGNGLSLWGTKRLQKVWSLPRMAKRSSQAAMPLAAEVKSCNGMWRPDAASDRSWFRMGRRVSLWCPMVAMS